MNIQAFWNAIDQARGANPGEAAAKTPSANPEKLAAILKTLSTSEVKDFARHFNDQLIVLNKWSIWGAGYVITQGMGDDSFHYFRSWLIGKGKAAVELAFSDPDSIGYFVTEEDLDEGVDNELLEYVAIEILEEAGEEDPRDSKSGHPDSDPEGEPFDEDTVTESYPKLAKAFWE